ncbi:unnamed protein product [Litomosoides sigmodontis]|uniref:Uncharacterized protein n=1 Tax=Litomosoides sigmodontis TaxID=42156 RepID=A0A3P6UGV0_LITSI|nr:unnamed protein product [Litomosoides sigmodontis]
MEGWTVESAKESFGYLIWSVGAADNRRGTWAEEWRLGRVQLMSRITCGILLCVPRYDCGGGSPCSRG